MLALARHGPALVEHGLRERRLEHAHARLVVAILEQLRADDVCVERDAA